MEVRADGPSMIHPPRLSLLQNLSLSTTSEGGIGDTRVRVNQFAAMSGHARPDDTMRYTTPEGISGLVMM